MQPLVPWLHTWAHGKRSHGCTVQVKTRVLPDSTLQQVLGQTLLARPWLHMRDGGAGATALRLHMLNEHGP